MDWCTHSHGHTDKCQVTVWELTIGIELNGGEIDTKIKVSAQIWPKRRKLCCWESNPRPFEFDCESSAQPLSYPSSPDLAIWPYSWLKIIQPCVSSFLHFTWTQKLFTCIYFLFFILGEWGVGGRGYVSLFAYAVHGSQNPSVITV